MRKRLPNTQGVEIEQVERSLLKRRRFGMESEAMPHAQRHAHSVADQCAEMIDEFGKAIGVKTVASTVLQASPLNVGIAPVSLHLPERWLGPAMVKPTTSVLFDRARYCCNGGLARRFIQTNLTIREIVYK
jgi:hypothetical protein